MGLETDGSVTQPTSPRLFSETITAKSVYIYCFPSLEISLGGRRDWHRALKTTGTMSEGLAEQRAFVAVMF